MIQIIILVDVNDRSISRGRGVYDTVSDGAGQFDYNGTTTKATFRNKTKNGRSFVLVTGFEEYDSFIIDEDNNFYGELRGLFYNSKYGVSVEGFYERDKDIGEIGCQNLFDN